MQSKIRLRHLAKRYFHKMRRLWRKLQRTRFLQRKRKWIIKHRAKHKSFFMEITRSQLSTILKPCPLNPASSPYNATSIAIATRDSTSTANSHNHYTISTDSIIPGGRLSHFVQQWKQLVNHPWPVPVIQQGPPAPLTSLRAKCSTSSVHQADAVCHQTTQKEGNLFGILFRRYLHFGEDKEMSSVYQQVTEHLRTLGFLINT